MRHPLALALTLLALAGLATLAGCGGPTTTPPAGGTPAAINSGAAGGSPASPAGAAAPEAGAAPELAAPKPTADPQRPKVIIETSMGDIPVVLNREKAPMTVDHFLQYAAEGHYTQTVFHQVYQGYAIHGGMYTADLQAKPASRTVRNEAANGLPNRRGTIAMARQPDVVDSATTQFFINLADNSSKLDYRGWGAGGPDSRPEDYGYCVFGEVTPEGMAVVDRIAAVDVEDVSEFDCVPVSPVVIKGVREAR